jgi:UDP-N-acetyl-2-amino-2-deoxyglucuronate dehydrogenase
MNLLPVIEGRRIRVAIVGCGRISRNHFLAIERHAVDIELVAICDINRDVLSEHVDRYRVPGYLRIDEMLQSASIDIVILCTPSGLHPDQTILAATHGVNVVTEKPMATRWRDGLRMVKACDEAGVRLFVVKQNRRNTTLQLLKRAITEGRFRKIHLVQLNVFWSRPQSYYDQGDGWRGTWEFDGGAFMNQASHYVDLLDWLVGPVERVHAITSTARSIEAEDTGVVNIKWRNGALGSMSVTMLTYPRNFEGSITLLGETGTVRVGGVAVNEIQNWEFADRRSYDDSVKEVSYETTSVYGVGHPLYYANLVEVMRGVAHAETDGRAGLRSLEVLTAIYRSARDGLPVGLPLEL